MTRNRSTPDAVPRAAGLTRRGIREQLRVSVSLYQVQKVLFAVNRDRQARTRFLDNRERLLADYELTAEERRALLDVDFHALYQMGVHSLLLGPLAATLGVTFPDYLAAIRGTQT
jgi:hypothetical protein